jgi:hypothetical protein
MVRNWDIKVKLFGEVRAIFAINFEEIFNSYLLVVIFCLLPVFYTKKDRQSYKLWRSLKKQ